MPTAIRLADPGAAVDIHWFEEPVPPESYHALRQVRDQVRVPICVGERLHTRLEFVPVLEQRPGRLPHAGRHLDGGISELKKIATMAEAYYVPVSPHDASGPINLLAGAHVMMTVPNFYRPGVQQPRPGLTTSSGGLAGQPDGRLRLPAGLRAWGRPT